MIVRYCQKYKLVNNEIPDFIMTHEQKQNIINRLFV
jgi:hypothetical protein